MNDYSRYVPWAVVTLAGLFLLLALVPPDPGDRQMRLYEFGQLPVVSGGRVKPLDSVARTTLLGLSNRQTWRDQAGNQRPAIEWLLDVMSSQLSEDRAADKHAVFRIDNDQVLELLKLEAKPGNFRYSLAEMAPRLAEFDDKAERAVLKRREGVKLDLLEDKVLDLRRNLGRYFEVARWHEPRVVPPRAEGQDWQPLGAAVRPYLEALVHKQKDAPIENPAGEAYLNMLAAYAKKDAKAFNAELAAYQKQLAKERPADVKVAKFEAAFNHFEPFYQCSLLYLGAFLLTCLGWLAWREALHPTAFWLTVLTLVVHTGALIARTYISGRPPVTNLYSSAVFIGWAAVILGLVIERVYGLGLGCFVAAVAGSVTGLIAHFLGTGDTLDVLQAVLDTNFWLATHVTCITLGYAATYVAGILGMVFIALGVFTPLLSRDLFKTLGQAIYGVTCFAMFLSFTGTVLGGIWADQSWGRFWGWDPKENGALLIVLINAILLHARWGGLIQQRGMAVVAVSGNIVTTWSWFGVNMLGVGLHSYGFMDGAKVAILSAVFTFLSFIAAGLVPKRLWRSFATPPPRQARPRLKPAH